MDKWKYFDITHRNHILCNPMHSDKLDQLLGLLALPSEARVIDIACGKAELLVRLAERYCVSAIGVDLSPHCIRDARQKQMQRVPTADLTFVEMDGAKYRPEPGTLFDLALCIGASWIYGGHQGTLRALREMVRPGGLIAVGEPHWRGRPDPEYLALTGYEESAFGSHAGNIEVAEQLGLIPLYALVSNEDDWDQYEALQWYAAEDYAAQHPEDPDVPELLSRARQGRSHYLRWGRDALGWAIYLFRSPL